MQTLQQLQNNELRGTTSLKLSEKLSVFPSEILSLADTLEVLDLSQNNLSELPADFSRLKKLKILFCSENQFRVFPEVLADCPELEMVGFKSNQIESLPGGSLNLNLRWLILTNNCITELPETIGDCRRMQKLMLAGNRLTALPEALKECRNLQLLRISANRLSHIPDWLLSMPSLAWLAFSGNPLNQRSLDRPVKTIDWSDLSIEQTLGEGASGIIYKANWQKAGEIQEVAVKVFRGAVTSDGLPEDEMAACIAAGIDRGLIKLIGSMSGHPGNHQGLVMDLIPENYSNLGGPPSFASCTRDVFKREQQLSLGQILKIGQTMAAVMENLHDKGIMHGDLYAHNILTDTDGDALFGDFGAASFYPDGNPGAGAALQGMEVKAYGYLLEDLIALGSEVENPEAFARLGELRDQCTRSTLSRPSFKELKEEFNKLLSTYISSKT